MELDHVLIAVTDLAVAARAIEARYGLASIEGGRHPDWGTANRIVPLGQTYLELVAVVDEAKAAESAFGRWVAGVGPSLAQPLGWAVRTNELDGLAQRLGLSIRPGARAIPGGEPVRWRCTGIEQAAAEPSLPFFIEWGPGTPLPGRADVSHSVGAVEVARLVLDGDAARLDDWLGKHALPIIVRRGAPALASIVLSGADGEIILAAPLL